ncbi:hypothetical protein AAON49_13880 [Pseudotenacibaculum sp. MALMAid0570]|uniref:hypothetical protein n=1 Tax=Pseudotenacibaculum sp. MALMAid0570 TaxID=3143938 RepID=UPI0032DEC392
MKKSILNIGTALNKKEQKQINGGGPPIDVGSCATLSWCNSTCDGECIACISNGSITGFACFGYANQ